MEREGWRERKRLKCIAEKCNRQSEIDQSIPDFEKADYYLIFSQYETLFRKDRLLHAPSGHTSL